MQEWIERIGTYLLSMFTGTFSFIQGGMQGSDWGLNDIGVVVGIVGIVIKSTLDIKRYLDKKDR